MMLRSRRAALPRYRCRGERDAICPRVCPLLYRHTRTNTLYCSWCAERYAEADDRAPPRRLAAAPCPPMEWEALRGGAAFTVDIDGVTLKPPPVRQRRASSARRAVSPRPRPARASSSPRRATTVTVGRAARGARAHARRLV
jgi:hypothetical protein